MFKFLVAGAFLYITSKLKGTEEELEETKENLEETKKELEETQEVLEEIVEPEPPETIPVIGEEEPETTSPEFPL